MVDDPTTEQRPFKPWSDFGKKQFKEEIDEGWPARLGSGSGPYDVVIQVEGTNPISGYRVILRPA
jgi:hypothetical protein